MRYATRSERRLRSAMGQVYFVYVRVSIDKRRVHKHTHKHTLTHTQTHSCTHTHAHRHAFALRLKFGCMRKRKLAALWQCFSISQWACAARSYRWGVAAHRQIQKRMAVCSCKRLLLCVCVCASLEQVPTYMRRQWHVHTVRHSCVSSK